nr:zf-CCHC domain-containing protein/UBN2 domain-containing protein [Tanacetum cinerariifolium]
MVIYNALPRKEYERIFMYESIDSAFARFNSIFTSLKALDEGYSSKNYVKKFLRALHPKWREKVTAIEESKDLTSLSLYELIENLKVYEMIIKKDSKIVKAKFERKSLALKAKKESSDGECSTFGSEDEEYAMAEETSRSSLKEEVDSCGDPNHLIGECPKPLKDENQRAFVGCSWSDSSEEDDKKVKNKTCLVDQASSEISCLEAKKESNDEDSTTFDSEDEEYAMAVKEFKKFFKRQRIFVRQTRDERKSPQRSKNDKTVKVKENALDVVI